MTPTHSRGISGRRILIVDDHRDGAEATCAMLRILGATVRVAQTGRAALDCLDQFSPDTMLLDLGLPDMDGCAVARQVRATPAHARMLLIALTGWGDDQDYRRTREAGFDHHLLKPADFHTLRGLLTGP